MVGVDDGISIKTISISTTLNRALLVLLYQKEASINVEYGIRLWSPSTPACVCIPYSGIHFSGTVSSDMYQGSSCGRVHSTAFSGPPG
jgi:hypothetical protein